MTDPKLLYCIRHHITGRWAARRGKVFHWHARRARACKVRGGSGLDALLKSRDDLKAEPAASRNPYGRNGR